MQFDRNLRNGGNESGVGGFEEETQSCEPRYGQKIKRESKKERELVFKFNNEKRGRQTGALSTWN